MQVETPVRVYLHCEKTNEQRLLKFKELPTQFVTITDEARTFGFENPKWIVKSKDNEEFVVNCIRDILYLIEDQIISSPKCIHLYVRDRAAGTKPVLDETLLGYRVTMSGCPVHVTSNNGVGTSEQNKAGLRFAFGVAPDQDTDLKIIEEAVSRIATQHCYCTAFSTVADQLLSREPKPQQK
jgi:hypothetical protein